MKVPFTFPASPEEFSAYQEMLMNRQLTEDEREILSAWAPLFNASFGAGRRNDNEWLKQKLETMDLLLDEHAASSLLTDFLKVTRRWLAYAWRQGKAVAA